MTAKKAKAPGTIKVTLVRSTIGRPKDQETTVRSLRAAQTAPDCGTCRHAVDPRNDHQSQPLGRRRRV